MNLSALKQRLLRPFSKKKVTFRTVSDKEWIVRPATRTVDPPAIYLESDLERVTGVMEATTLEWEMQRVRGGEKEHRPTRAFLLTDVDLRDGILRKGAWSNRLLKEPVPSTKNAPPLSITDASIGCTLFGSIYFAHWITDDLTLSLAAAEFGTPLVVERKLYDQEPEYRQLFQMDAAMTSRARIDRFVMLDDLGQNEYKRERYQTLRQRLRSACPTPSINKRVYFRRGTKGAPRVLVNTAEIETWLASQGFTIVDPEHLTPTQIAHLANGAELAIGVEGSQLVHGLLNLADGGAFCQIQPPYRFNNLFKDYADCLGMPYAFTVGYVAEGGFTLPLDDLKRLLDRVEAVKRLK